MSDKNMDMEALTAALALSINAPTQEKADKCAAIAESIAARLSSEQVEHCKKMAIIRAETNNYKIEQPTEH